MLILFSSASYASAQEKALSENADAKPTKEYMVSTTNKYVDCISDFDFQDLDNWNGSKLEYFSFRQSECRDTKNEVLARVQEYYPERYDSTNIMIDDSAKKIFDLRIYKLFNNVILDSLD